MGCSSVEEYKNKKQTKKTKKKQKVTVPVYVASTWRLDRSSPNVKSIDIKLCLWRRVEASCFSTTMADAINTAKPCRAACDVAVMLAPL